MIKLIDKDKYHDTVEYEGAPIISSHILKHACSRDGGSVKRLEVALEKIKQRVEEKEEGEEEEVAKHNVLGTLLHSYIEDKDKFVVEDENLPDEWVCKVVRGARKKIQTMEGNLKDLPLHMHREAVINSARSQNIQPKWKDDTIANRVIGEGTSYYDFLTRNDGKTMISPAHKQALQGMVDGIARSEWAELLLEHKCPEGECMFEIPMLWTMGDSGIVCKSMPDIVRVFPKRQIIIIDDPKTTSQNVEFLYKKPTLSFFQGQLAEDFKPGPIITYKYYRQVRFYYEPVLKFLNEFAGIKADETWKVQYGIIGIESTGIHAVKRFSMNSDIIQYARLEIEDAMRAVSQLYHERQFLKF